MVEKQRNLGLIFAALMTTMLMSALGQMIFTTALPTIVGELGGVDQMAWVTTAFAATMTFAMPIAGKVGDVVGRKWLYITFIGIFVVGSALGGFADNMTLLILARAIQGFGAGGMMINSQSIIAEVTTARERGKFMGLMGAVFGVASILGPVLGGWFTDGPGWRWGLWMNIPLGLLAMTVSAVVLKLRTGEKTLGGYDWLGTALMIVTTSSLILMTTWGGSIYAWTDPLILTLATITLIGAVAFVWVEIRARDPLIPMWLFKKRNMALTTLTAMILGIAMMGPLGYLPTYLQMVHTLTPTLAGLMMIPMMVGMIFTSSASGWIIARTGNYKTFPIVGMIVLAGALWWMSTLTPETSLVELGIMFLIFGIGLGMVQQVLVLIVQNSFPITIVGTATATNNFFRQIGASLGLSVVGSAFIFNLQTQLQQHAPQMGDADSLTPELVAELAEPLKSAVLVSYNDALTPIFLLMAPLALLGAALLIPIRREKLKETIE